MEDLAVDPAFWRGRAVLVTGHTGFKGAWLVLWLRALGARVTGLAVGPPTAPSLYELARAGEGIAEVAADVRDAAALAAALDEHRPEVVLHLAAQPLVRASLRDPSLTYAINVTGTVNVLEAVRATPGVRAAVVVTSDKVYDNPPGRARRAFREDDPLGGRDPYSSSKACAELVTLAYRSMLTAEGGARLATARAGNVIGGGDWGRERLVPDVMRAALTGEVMRVRSPDAVRPWQHVLAPLEGYLRLARALCAGPGYESGWNFGPAAGDAQTVRRVVEALAARWGDGLRWEVDADDHPPEAHHLQLDCAKAAERLGWAGRWDLDTSLDAVVAWYRGLRDGADVRALTLSHIGAYAQDP